MTTESTRLGADGLSAPRPIRKRKYSRTTYRGRITLPALGAQWHRDYNDHVLLKDNRELGRVIPGACAGSWAPKFCFGALKQLPILGKPMPRNAYFSYGDHSSLTRAKDAVRGHAETLLNIRGQYTRGCYPGAKR